MANVKEWIDTVPNNGMGNNEGNVIDTLKQRGSIYGNYADVLKARVDIMNILKQHHERVNGTPMEDKIAMGFSDNVLKLVRAAGKPGYADSWHDLGGYAKLMEDEAEKK